MSRTKKHKTQWGLLALCVSLGCGGITSSEDEAGLLWDDPPVIQGVDLGDKAGDTSPGDDSQDISVITDSFVQGEPSDSSEVDLRVEFFLSEWAIPQSITVSVNDQWQHPSRWFYESASNSVTFVDEDSVPTPPVPGTEISISYALLP